MRSILFCTIMQVEKNTVQERTGNYCKELVTDGVADGVAVGGTERGASLPGRPRFGTPSLGNLPAFSAAAGNVCSRRAAPTARPSPSARRTGW